MADKAPKFPTGAYMDFVNGVLDTLPDRLSVRAKDNGAYARIPKPIANYMAGPLALASISRALDNMESHGQPRHQVIGELEKAERRDIQEYTDVLVIEARDDENPLIVSAVYYMLMAKLPEVIKHFKQAPNAVTWWTRAPADFDGFNTFRTGNTVDLAYSVFTPAVTYYEVKIEPSAVDWQTRRYSSGNYASMNDEEKRKMEEEHAKSLLEQAQDDMLKAAWPEFIAKLKSFDINYNSASGDRNPWSIGGAGQSIIDAHEYVTDVYNKWHALAPIGYPQRLREAQSLRNALDSKVESAQYDVVSMAKQSGIDEHNRAIFQQAYSIAEEWMRANDIDTVTPYFSQQVKTAGRHYQQTRGPYYAALRSAAVVLGDDTDKIYPAIGTLPIFSRYPRADYFVDATEAILTSPHEHDTAAVDWMRKNMKLFANGNTAEVIVLPRASAYVVKTSDHKSSGFMAMTGSAAHTTLSGSDKASATRAMAAGKAVTFSFAPRGIDRPTYPHEFAERICSMHAVKDWRGKKTKWKLAK